MPRLDLTRLPRGRAGQLLALGILIGGGAISVLLIALPAFTFWQELDNELQILQQEADSYSRLIAHQDDIRKALMARRAELASTTDYLTAADPILAAAQVQRDLSARAETAGVTVRTTLTLPSTTADDFVSVGFELSVSGPLPSLRNFLYSVEADQPRLIVDRMILRLEQDPDTSAEAALHAMTLDLHGYMQKAGVR